eukprot:3233260-Amphidinium_carterae.1
MGDSETPVFLTARVGRKYPCDITPLLRPVALQTEGNHTTRVTASELRNSVHTKAFLPDCCQRCSAPCKFTFAYH